MSLNFGHSNCKALAAILLPLLFLLGCTQLTCLCYALSTSSSSSSSSSTCISTTNTNIVSIPKRPLVHHDGSTFLSRPPCFHRRHHRNKNASTTGASLLFAANDDEGTDNNNNNNNNSNEETPKLIMGALPPSALDSAAATADNNNNNDSSSSSSSSSSVAEQLDLEVTTDGTTTFMITNSMKRVLIEELGYKRDDVDRLRPELAAPIIEKRMFRPTDGIPSSWEKEEADNKSSSSSSSSSSMIAKLENESKYPLKVPLLSASLILFGKGCSDAIVILIKVQQGFKGASLTEQFMGVPVLAIDFVCVLVGISIGAWTLANMKD